MKIVNREIFLSLPPNTVFQKYTPSVFDDIMIKSDSWEKSNDFLYQGLSGSIDSDDSEDYFKILDSAEKNGASVLLDFDCISRDGCFDDDQLFAIWEKPDIEQLIEKLKDCL